MNEGDFNRCRFDIIAADASLSAKFQAKVPFLKKMGATGVVGGAQYIIRLHTGEETLEAAFDGFKVTPKFDVKLKPEIEKSPKTAWDTVQKLILGTCDLFEVTSPKKVASGSVGGALGAGMLVYQGGVAEWKIAAPHVGTGTAGSNLTNATPAAFERDKWELNRKANGWEVRFLLETLLATDLAIFSGVPMTEFHGYASPEGPTNTINFSRSLVPWRFAKPSRTPSGDVCLTMSQS